jgi:hypothetical protein
MAAIALLVCATRQPDLLAAGDEELPTFSAERLGDGDEPDAPAAVEEERYLTPAEREALAAQGYEPRIDDRVTTQTRVEPPASEAKEKGAWGRAGDHIGRGFVAVASVALVVGAAVAPFFLF